MICSIKTNHYYSSNIKGAILQELIEKKTDKESVAEWFEKIATYLLNETSLMINSEPHRLVEIEFYYREKKEHDDLFVHGDSAQKTCGKWYFHRSGGTYKSGSFKGIDLTFAEKDAFGGILIRGIEKPDGSIIDGPSLCVDYLLSKTASETVSCLDKKIFPCAIWDSKSLVFFEENKELNKRSFIATPRVGLTLKMREKAVGMQPFIMKKYRFISSLLQTKKGKIYSILALHTSGKMPEEIRVAIGSTRKAISNHISFFEEGYEFDDFSCFIGEKLNSQKLAQLYGTWWKIFKNN